MTISIDLDHLAEEAFVDFSTINLLLLSWIIDYPLKINTLDLVLVGSDWMLVLL